MSPPVVLADGSSYSGGDDGVLYALRPNGKVKWTFAVDKPKKFDLDKVQVNAPAVSTDGTVYVTAGDRLHALTSDGTKKWDFQTGIPRNEKGSFEYEDQKTYSWLKSAPVLGSDGTVYFGSGEGKLYAIGPDGKKKWESKAAAQVQASPAIGTGGTIYFTCYDGKLYAVSPNGALEWTLEIPRVGEGFASDTALARDGTIYVQDGGQGTLYAVRPDGRIAWEHTFPTDQYGWGGGDPAVARDGTIYVAGLGLHVLTPDGKEKWSFASSVDFYHSAVIGADGTVYVSEMEKHVYAVSPGGKQKWRLALAGDRALSLGPPVVGRDGTLYLGGMALGNEWR